MKVSWHALICAFAVCSSAAATQRGSVQALQGATDHGGRFGDAVDIEGELALVGAPAPDGPGSAHVFAREPQGWTEIAELMPAGAGGAFGSSVAIHGSIAVIGDPAANVLGLECGAVHVFESSAGVWRHTATLHAAEAARGARFGGALALEGTRLAVGAPGAGALYVFERAGAETWIEVARLMDAEGRAGDGAGTALALDDGRILCGAPGRGAASVYEEVAPGSWILAARIADPEGASRGRFGAAVDLDGDVAVVGAPEASACGSAYVFERSGPHAWVETGRIGAGDTPEGELGERAWLGAAVAVSGRTIALGAPGGARAGSVLVYRSGLSGFVRTQRVSAPRMAVEERFGAALALDAGTLLVGAPGTSRAGGAGGSAYLVSSDGIVIENEAVRFTFSEPPSAPFFTSAVGTNPTFPHIAIEDLLDANPIFSGHLFEHLGQLWELGLVEHPHPFLTLGAYDVTAEDEVYRATADDCDPWTFDLQSPYLDPLTGSSGSLLTLLWTGCHAQGLTSPGPFEVAVRIFLPDGASEALFDLSARASGTGNEWAFWHGKLNLSLLEHHPEPPDPPLEYFLLTPFGQVVRDPALNLVGNSAQGLPSEVDGLGRVWTQVLGFYDELGHGLSASLRDVTGDRAKNFQFSSTPGADGIDPRVNMSAITYQPDVTPGAEFQAITSLIGRFRGDWFDVAARYRQWMEDEAEFTSKGYVKDRSDVPAFAKRLEMVAVLGVGAAEYGAPPALGSPVFKQPLGVDPVGVAGLGSAHTPAQSLTDRLQLYMDHWDLERLITTQFGTLWAGGCEGIGTYDPLSAFLPTALAMQEKEDQLASLGRDFKYMLYLYDMWHPEFPLLGTTYPEDGALIKPSGDPIADAFTCPGTTLLLMDPSVAAWQDHMESVCYTLGGLGIDGVYCDNAFPELYQYDFSTTHGHPPGFGPYMTQGFGDTFAAMQRGGNDGKDSAGAEFMTYTESFCEGFLPRSNTYGPEWVLTDWITGDDRSFQVPLISTLFHHYTVLGPPLVEYYTDDSKKSSPNNVWNAISKAERVKGRRGANYTMAWGWVNGTPIWSPDPALADPVDKRFSFELDDLELGLAPGTLDEVHAVCDFGAELARVRGYPLVRPFLATGMRLRDLENFSTSPSSVDVVLLGYYNPYAGFAGTTLPLGSKLDAETGSFPPIAQGIWRDLDTGDVGVALANFTDGPATAIFVIDPSEYGFAGAVSVYRVFDTGEALIAGPFSAPKSLTIPLSAESTRFLRIGD